MLPINKEHTNTKENMKTIHQVVIFSQNNKIPLPTELHPASAFLKLMNIYKNFKNKSQIAIMA